MTKKTTRKPKKKSKVDESSTAAIAHVLDHIPERQRLVISLLYYEELTHEETAYVLDATPDEVKNLQILALHAIHHWYPNLPISAKIETLIHTEDKARLPTVQEVVAAVRELTPGLIAHLREHERDLLHLKPDIFEHLVGEFLAKSGFHKVHHVGRATDTSADIFAIKKLDEIGQEIRFFVEVKRWKNRVGIEVINQVVGAMILEEPEFGWHAAMIVSAAGFKNLQKIDRTRLDRRRVSLKDQHSIKDWLDGYQPNKNGLWLPKPIFYALEETAHSGTANKQQANNSLGAD
jgi:hypothetical protein